MWQQITGTASRDSSAWEQRPPRPAAAPRPRRRREPDPAILYEALFASELQSSQRPSPAEIRTAIHRTLAALGAMGCAGRVAQEFGDHPETAITRMRWATSAVTGAYAAV